MKTNLKLILLLAVFCLTANFSVHSQGIYTARGYWEESNKPTYKQIKHKQTVGDTLDAEELDYLNDFELFLFNYYNKMSTEEQNLYQKMKEQWDRESSKVTTSINLVREPNDFEWRLRERFVSIGYGVYYGSTMLSIFPIESAGAAGIPFITGGMWALGPLINPKKFEGIDRSVIRANNSGRLLGLIFGASLGLMVGGNNGDQVRTTFIGSTIGSIGLGEYAFQLQKKRRYSEGHIEIMRHHGLLGSYVGLSTIAAGNGEQAWVYGLGSLLGGGAGLYAGNIASRNYPYTKGDGRYATNMSNVSVGLGFAIANEIAFNGSEGSGLALIPAGFGIIGTYLGQRKTQGVNLSAKQGSTINYASTGAAFVGVGIAALAESESATVYLALGSGFALITQEFLFHKYKNENLSLKGNLGKAEKNNIKYSLDFNPENYFLNQQLQAKANNFSNYSQLSNPVVNLNFKF
ncbi:hypothetical protein ACFOUP_10625 [Belliella kenyensis]|uniref:Uncharacterized protein n=1 Tax=Belliella kenyensis TaxID=1472724 RepID=A0ABV8EKL9_9BACT|nr:hypothetical protein [Belliella kenyensis]MCH7400476.1 hypothetical protein [Belliella kenyensis]MDN3604508.1 hypothetical protein [Belliella kenyensis]